MGAPRKVSRADRSLYDDLAKHALARAEDLLDDRRFRGAAGSTGLTPIPVGPGGLREAITNLIPVLLDAAQIRGHWVDGTRTASALDPINIDAVDEAVREHVYRQEVGDRLRDVLRKLGEAGVDTNDKDKFAAFLLGMLVFLPELQTYYADEVLPRIGVSPGVGGVDRGNTAGVPESASTTVLIAIARFAQRTVPARPSRVGEDPVANACRRRVRRILELDPSMTADHLLQLLSAQKVHKDPAVMEAVTRLRLAWGSGDYPERSTVRRWIDRAREDINTTQ